MCNYASFVTRILRPPTKYWCELETLVHSESNNYSGCQIIWKKNAAHENVNRYEFPRVKKNYSVLFMSPPYIRKQDVEEFEVPKQ